MSMTSSVNQREVVVGSMHSEKLGPWMRLELVSVSLHLQIICKPTYQVALGSFSTCETHTCNWYGQEYIIKGREYRTRYMPCGKTVSKVTCQEFKYGPIRTFELNSVIEGVVCESA